MIVTLQELYLTRPDIESTVFQLTNTAARAFCDDHWSHAERVMKYLHATPARGVTVANSINNMISMKARSQAKRNLMQDNVTIGMIVTIRGGSIFWNSKRVNIAGSRQEDIEIVAAHEAVKIEKWHSHRDSAWQQS